VGRGIEKIADEVNIGKSLHHRYSSNTVTNSQLHSTDVKDTVKLTT